MDIAVKGADHPIHEKYRPHLAAFFIEYVLDLVCWV